MQPGDEISIELAAGKTLEVRLQAIGETHDDGDARVFFELNGQPRTVRVPDRKVASTAARRKKAEPGNAAQIGAPMPGVIASVGVVAGQQVRPGDLMLTIEAMKMETGIHSDRAGTILAVHADTRRVIDAKDLMIEFELAGPAPA